MFGSIIKAEGCTEPIKALGNVKMKNCTIGAAVGVPHVLQLITKSKDNDTTRSRVVHHKVGVEVFSGDIQAYTVAYIAQMLHY